MATSQNGWPIVGPDKVDRTPIQGVLYPNGFLKGDVWKAFNWLFRQLNARVEAVELGIPNDEWGYYVKVIEGTTTKSNHGSATAGDYNASRHSMGVRGTFSPAQVTEIHQILAEADYIFRWGGDYEGRPDEMHFEIVADELAVHRFILSLEMDSVGLPVKGDQSEDVDYWQNIYNSVRGNLPLLKVDGDYGPDTETAFAKWCRANGASNVYPGSKVTGWMAHRMHLALIKAVAPSVAQPVVDADIIRDAVSTYLDNKFADKRLTLTGEVDGRITLL